MAPASKVLQDVVAVVISADALHNAKAALQQRLQQHGAHVPQRLNKDVTHVVFERGARTQRPENKAAEEEKLAKLYKNLDGVSMLWRGCVRGCLPGRDAVAHAARAAWHCRRWSVRRSS